MSNNNKSEFTSASIPANSLLAGITGPDDVKSLDREKLPTLAQDIRDALIHRTSINGGHIGPNLGVTELTLMLHRLFDFKTDRITMDVAHQGYVHKLLTGRQGEFFDKLRKSGGMCGFLTREESEYDCFGAGHAGTALSAALGMAKARDNLRNDNHVIALIGDAALTCGITMEALNNICAQTKRMIVILNDNEWSIAKNVGAISKYLNNLITNPAYNKFHQSAESVLEKIPGGQGFMNMVSKAKKETKDLLVPSSLFEKFGMRYIGPIDGHDFDELEKYLTFCRDVTDQPILLHVNTVKGKGYDVALKNPQKFHGTGPYKIESGESAGSAPSSPKYESVFGITLTSMAKKDPRIVGITAAMPGGTGLSHLASTLPEQFVDVGIAEEHAVVFAAGLATEGMKPVCAIYSTFLQRAYDPVIHDVCLQKLDVTFCMDRAGLSANDGPTHHGVFDIAYLRPIPRVVLMQPKDEDELADMVKTAVEHKGPTFVRYPRGPGEGVKIKDEAEILEIGRAEVLQEGSEIALWALGPMVSEAQKIAEMILKETGLRVTIVNARFAKPIDSGLLKKHAQSHKLIVSMEDGVISGGLGSGMIEILQDAGIMTPIERLGWPDEFIPHGTSNKVLRESFGLGTEQMKMAIESAYSLKQTPIGV